MGRVVSGTRLTEEMFQYIEKKGKDGVTSREIAERFWMSRTSARVILSRYTNYRGPDGKARRFLTYRPPPPGSVRGGKHRILGVYVIEPGINDEWWGFVHKRRV